MIDETVKASLLGTSCMYSREGEYWVSNGPSTHFSHSTFLPQCSYWNKSDIILSHSTPLQLVPNGCWICESQGYSALLTLPIVETLPPPPPPQPHPAPCTHPVLGIFLFSRGPQSPCAPPKLLQRRKVNYIEPFALWIFFACPSGSSVVKLLAVPGLNLVVSPSQHRLFISNELLQYDTACKRSAALVTVT